MYIYLYIIYLYKIKFICGTGYTYICTVHVCTVCTVCMYSWIAHVRNFHCQEFPTRKINSYVPLTLTTDFLWTRSL